MSDSTFVKAGDLCVYLGRKVATVRGRPISLNPTAWRLLVYLAERKGTPIPKTDLLDAIFGPNHLNLKALDRPLAELRRAIMPTHPQRYIESVQAKGIRLRDPA